MSNNELLDIILASYLYGEKFRLTDDPKYKKMTFEFIARTQANSQKFNLEDWHLEFLKGTLINDGFLEASKNSGSEPYTLTPQGVKAAQKGWYRNSEINAQRDEEIKKQTLANFKRSKYSLVIAILALIVSTTISVYSLWKKEQPMLNEIRELQQQINKLENQRNEHEIKLNRTVVNLLDSLGD